MQNQKVKTSKLAKTALVFGIMSFLTYGILSPIAIVFGFVSLFQIRGSRGRLKGIWLAILGIVLGVAPIVSNLLMEIIFRLVE